MDYIDLNTIIVNKYTIKQNYSNILGPQKELKMPTKSDLVHVQNNLNKDIQNKKDEMEKEIENEISKAQKEILNLKKDSISSINAISQEITSNIIEKILGDRMNESSIKAAVEEISKNKIGKYL